MHSVTYLKGAPSAPVAGVHSPKVGKKEKLVSHSNHKKLKCGSYTLIDEISCGDKGGMTNGLIFTEVKKSLINGS